MRIFMIHVGNEVPPPKNPEDPKYLRRKALLSSELVWFSKHDIVNADTQMQSLIEKGVSVDYGHISARKSPLALFKAGLEIRSVSKRKDIDLVHVLWGSTTGLLTAIFARKPVIVSFCGSDLLGNKDINGKLTKSGKLNRLLSRTAARLATFCITKSEQMISFLPKSVAKKSVAVPNGVNLEGFSPMQREEAKKKLGWDSDKKYILFFYTPGQVVKNPNLARQVFVEVKSQLANVELVELTGVAHEELVYFYNASDVMLITSFHEGSNNSIKEAMACNCPVVAVPCGDAPERLKGVSPGGVYSYDKNELAHAVLDVISSNKRSDAAMRVNQFSKENIANKVIDVYKEVLTK